DNTSELKTTEQQTEIGHELDSEHENQATINELDNVQQSASESDLDNMSDIKVETLSDETATNTTGNNYAEAKTTTSNKQQSDKSDASIDNDVVSNHQSDNPDEYSEQSVQEPLLKPEPTSQLGGTKTSNENENKPTIRRGPNIKLPNVELLEAPKQHEIDESWIEDKKQELNEAFYYFNVPAEVQNVTEGPSVTRFELSVEKGVKVSRITALQDDIKMALAAKDIRIEAPIAGTSLVGIEVPNQNSTIVNLRSIIEEPAFKNSESKLTVAMGLRINNEPLLMDISKTPHALIAGATGSGKSVCINSILMSLLYKNHPEELKLLLIDPKMVELAPYNDLPHLVSPVITDVKAATQSLKWAVDEMERRYKVFAKYHVRNITAFNKKATYEDRMPKIVIVIDELADLMMMAPQEVEQSIARIAQKARACGIHMLVATQRPSVNVITGLIKANIPTRVAFMVSSSVDSRTILDSGGAERLLGYGDMLYLGSGMNKPIRVQGTFVSDEEIDDVVDFIKEQRDPEYLFEEKELLKKTESQPQDDLFDDVCQFMLNEGHISTSLIQRHFQIGYNRAARIVDQLEQLGYVSGANGSKPRDVYITESDLNEN
ncbi:MAG: DNA translocase FtsK, partial [Staphylococcus xylosus]|nr:DNA translocase FtsK [Staphylococcus xylosus]